MNTPTCARCGRDLPAHTLTPICSSCERIYAHRRDQQPEPDACRYTDVQFETAYGYRTRLSFPIRVF